jgi:hypothetical protein
MTAVFRSQWILLDRRRTWIVAGTVTTLFTVMASALAVATAEGAGDVANGGMGAGILVGPGGATAGVTWALGFSSVLVLVTFIAAAANELTRGTFRTALLQRPGRLSFFAGKVAALMAVTSVLVVAALVIGSITAAIVAPGQGIDTTGWFGVDALGEAAVDLVRLLGWAFGWAVLGTTIGVVARSTPIALGVGVLWFGPIENILADSQDVALRWFPGQVLRAIIAPASPGVIDTPTAVVTLLAYLAVCVAVVAVTLQRRDVTA